MSFNSLARILLAMAISISAGHASALNLKSSNYTVYEGTSSLGDRFIYLLPRQGTLIIHGEIVTPISFMPKMPAYTMRINLDGSLSELAANNDLDAENIIAACNFYGVTCAPSSIALFSGDFDGDSQSDFAFQYSGRIHIVRDATGSSPEFYATLIPPPGTQIASISDMDANGGADIILTGNAGMLASMGNGRFKAQSVPLFSDTSLTGAIAGTFRVNEQGAATYNVPIMTFAGTAGVAPQISLNYNSQNGSGIAGVGWSVGGLSAISRCRQTEAQDGKALALSFGAGDRFCLDGQRLILTSGSTYGAPETKYRTEIDSGVEVTAKGGTTGNPGHFEVTRKDGSTSQYGNGNNAKQLAGSATLTWGISQFADSAGNPIKFHYTSDNNSGFRIDRIYYAFGANKSAATSGTYVAFTYGTRPDNQISYVNAARLANTVRLTRVETFNDNTSLRSYNLQYASALTEHGTTNRFVLANRSYLEALYECVGSQCLKPTKLEWLAKAGTSIDWNHGQTFTFENQSDRVSSWKPLDFNGDGLMDLAVAVADYDDDNDIHDMWIYIYQGLPEGGFSTYQAFAKHWSHSNNRIPMQIEVTDYNADGKQDLAYWIAGSSWRILLSEPTASGGWKIGTGNDTFDVDTGIQDSVLFADFDSDGLADALYHNWSDWPSHPLAINYRRLERNWSEPASSNKAYGFAAPVSLYNPDSAPVGWTLLAMYGMEGANGGLAPVFDLNGEGSTPFPRTV